MENGKLVEKGKGKNYSTRYKERSPDLDMKEQKSSAYKSRYSEALIPENQSEMKSKITYPSRY